MLQRRHGFQASGDRARARRLAALRASALETASGEATLETGGQATISRITPPVAKSANVAVPLHPANDVQPNGARRKGRKRASRAAAAPAVVAFRIAEAPNQEPARSGQSRSSADEVARQGVAVDTLLALMRSAGIQPSAPLMDKNTVMSMPRFKRLVAQMPKIAEIVGQFQSPEMQREVLQALIRAFESDDVDSDVDSEAEADTDTGSGSARKPAGNGRVRKQVAPAFVDPAAAAALLGAEAGDDSSIHS